MFETLIKLLNAEWATVSSAPWSFSITLATAFSVAYAACRWAYQRQLEVHKSRVEALKERLSAKDDLLNEYRERLKLIPSNGSKFSSLSSKNLQDQTLDFVQNLRSWFSKTENEMRIIDEQQRQAMSRAQNEEQRHQLWEARTSTHTDGHHRLMQEFEQKFKVDAILLRDELSTRLPPLERNLQIEHRYETPTNTFCIRAIADDLERRAKVLR